MRLLEVSNLKKIYGKYKTLAVNGVDFSVSKGEVVGLVGESGCGKSTIAKAILSLVDIQGGSIYYKDRNLDEMPAKEMRLFRKSAQIIFQDPYMSLDPRMKIGDILEEVFIIHYNFSRNDRVKKVFQLLETVGLNSSYCRRMPSELSGGEKQRVGIARALATYPEFIVCDEPVSSLDISVQAQILNLLMDFRISKNLTYLFISHDLDVIASICDRIIVMQSGRFVEQGSCEDLFKNPQHEYTKKLLKGVRGINL